MGTERFVCDVIIELAYSELSPLTLYIQMMYIFVIFYIVLISII